jgi:hypothetical protein
MESKAGPVEHALTDDDPPFEFRLHRNALLELAAFLLRPQRSTRGCCNRARLRVLSRIRSGYRSSSLAYNMERSMDSWRWPRAP